MAESDALPTVGYSRPVYYGWWVLGAAALTEMLAIGSTSYAAGLFVLPLQHDLALSRADANSALPISFAGAALIAPLIGYLLDRFPPQWVIGIGVVALGSGFITISMTSSIPLMVLALLFPVAAGGMAIGPLATSTLTSRWFYRRRGLALGIATVATSGGGILVVPLLSLAIEAYGWRAALLTEALLIVIIVVVLAAFVIRGGPADLNLQTHPENKFRPTEDIPIGNHAAVEGAPRYWQYNEIFSTLNFWAVAFVLAVITGINQAIVVTLIPYGSELGLAQSSAVFLISAFSISAAIVKVASGLLSDFVDRRTLMLAATLAMMGSLLLLSSSSNYVMLLLACCLAGTALGCVLPSSAILVAALFGSPSFGRVMGLIYVAVVVSSIVCSRFIGAIFDRTGGYRVAFLTFLAIAMISALATFLVRAPRREDLRLTRSGNPQAADLPPVDPANMVVKGSPR